MQYKNQYPLFIYYLLIDNLTKKSLKLRLFNKTYIFIVNRDYFLNQKKDFFSLKEKLYILNLSYDVVWVPISIFQMCYKVLLYNTISPTNLKLHITKGKAMPYISKKGAF